MTVHTANHGAAVDQVWEIPHPDTLTMAQLDEVLATTGIDIANGGAAGPGHVLAAIVTWTRRKAGETVEFDEVYRTLTNRQIRVTAMDPTPPTSTG